VTSLIDAVPAGGLQFGIQAADRDRVVDVVGELLTRLGLATADYTTAIHENLRVNGPYLVIAPGLALLHARPEAGALAPGLVLATLAEPVRFGHSTNDPVQVALGLTAVNAEGHLDALVAIANTFSRPGAIDAVAAATSPTDLRSRLLQLEASE
jgi:PTS system ascorbate-specific IIA component